MKLSKFDKVVLFNDKLNCCGCGSCYNACPKNAISMKEDENGFIYPEINSDTCIGCNKCTGVCAYNQELSGHEPVRVLAATATNTEKAKKSSSGGIFAIIAENILKENGVVYGASMLYDGSILSVNHIRVSDIDDLHLLQGSKYVQSDVNDCFKKVKYDLINGKKVLFTGTPCQCDALRSFLSQKYENLLIIDLICHGVPSQSLFRSYIKFEEKKHKYSIMNFCFRDKSKGQGMNYSFTSIKDNKSSVKRGDGRSNPYMSLFLKSLTYRINCYSCKYACGKRVSDITIGDYWGVFEEHPEIIEKFGSKDMLAVSCVLINTDNGMKLFKENINDIKYIESDFDKVARHNGQLISPSKLSEKREYVFSNYINNDFTEVVKYYNKTYWKEILVVKIKGLVPRELKRYLKGKRT